MMRKVAAVLFDLDQALVQEKPGSQGDSGAGSARGLEPAAVVAIRRLRELGYRLGLVADAAAGPCRDMLRRHGLHDCFDAFAISEEVGCGKPAPELFEKALADLGIGAGHRHRVIMVGDSLERDVAGANRAGLLSVWLRAAGQRGGTPETASDKDEERPVYVINTLEELVGVVREAEDALARGPGVFDPDLALRHAPVILFDREEPFLPDRVGCTVIDRPGPSPSFPRVFRPIPGERVIEYAIYWDWDIGHHYELEHAWVFLDARGVVRRVEASWHGRYHLIAGDRDPTLSRGVVLYSQPGKHAFAGTPETFDDRERFTRPCRDQAGNAGLLVTPLFEGIIKKTPADDAWAARYLRQRAFTPSFDFSKRFEFSGDMLCPWDELTREILQRIDRWRAALSAMLDAAP